MTDRENRAAQHAARCAFCRRALSRLEEYSGGVCGHHRCRTQQLEKELTDFRARSAQASARTAPERFPIVVVPHRSSEIVPLEPAQHAALEMHLTALARGASDASSPQGRPLSAEPDGSTAAGPSGNGSRDGTIPAVCAACQGFCCYAGGSNNAFLDAETVQRFARESGVRSPSEIVAAYLGHVPASHVDRSCVYHGSLGCTLPRRMRARICNEYECHGLRDARTWSERGNHLQLFVVARHDNTIVRGTFVDESAPS